MYQSNSSAKEQIWALLFRAIVTFRVMGPLYDQHTACNESIVILLSPEICGEKQKHGKEDNRTRRDS